MTEPEGPVHMTRGRRFALRRIRVLAPLLLMLSVLNFLGPDNLVAEVLSTFRVQYLWVGLLFLGLSAAYRFRRLAFVSALAVGVNLLWLWPCFPFSRSVHTEPPLARVFLSNVRTSNTEYERLLERIREADPDIVVLQEVNRKWIEAVHRLSDDYPYSLELPQEDNFGIAFYSRLPLKDLRAATFGTAGLPFISCKLVDDQGKVLGSILATHPVPPIRTDYLQIRNRDIDLMVDWCRERGAGPIAVVGDLNMTPWSPSFVRLERRGSLRHSRRGEGLHPTWGYHSVLMSPFRIPIDHVLAGKGWVAHNTRTLAPIGSDHLPLLVDIRPVLTTP